MSSYMMTSHVLFYYDVIIVKLHQEPPVFWTNMISIKFCHVTYNQPDALKTKYLNMQSKEEMNVK